MSPANLPNTNMQLITETGCITLTYFCIRNREFFFFQPLPKPRFLSSFSKRQNKGKKCFTWCLPEANLGERTTMQYFSSQNHSVITYRLVFFCCNLQVVVCPSNNVPGKQDNPKKKALFIYLFFEYQVK